MYIMYTRTLCARINIVCTVVLNLMHSQEINCYLQERLLTSSSHYGIKTVTVFNIQNTFLLDVYLQCGTVMVSERVSHHLPFST